MAAVLLLESEIAAKAAEWPGPALAEALRISGIVMLTIFAVMTLLGVMIALLQRIFPDTESGEGEAQP